MAPLGREEASSGSWVTPKGANTRQDARLPVVSETVCPDSHLTYMFKRSTYIMRVPTMGWLPLGPDRLKVNICQNPLNQTQSLSGLGHFRTIHLIYPTPWEMGCV